MDDEDAATLAIEELNGYDLHGRLMKVMNVPTFYSYYARSAGYVFVQISGLGIL